MMRPFCPYPGLRPFRQDENEIFFGRDEQVAALLDKLAQHHFLAVIAPSGYGKSSLVRTGLLNALSGGMLPQAGSYWRIADIHPANAPFQQLAAGLLKESCLRADYADALGMKDEELAATMPMLEESLCRNLRRGPYSLHEIWQQGAGQRPAGTKLLILADQFEELFRYAEKTSAGESAAFAALLLATAEHPDIYVILTMRTDFLGHCARFENLPEAVSRGLYLTPKMDRDQLQEAIEGPAEMSGGSIEPALVNRLLNDLSGQQDQLPLLQHCLMRLWHQAAAEETAQCLTLQAYERLGSLRSALSNHADEAYAELNSVQQRQAKVMFQALTEKESGLDTRRPETVGIIAQIVGQDWRELLLVIHAFRQQGRNFITATAPSAPVGGSGEQQDVLNEEALLDISHESLIRQWQRLRDWTDEEAQSARQYRRLCDKAEQWQQGNANLLWGTDLAVALNWQKKNQPTEVWARRYGGNFLAVLSFLEKSWQEEATENERERKRRRRTIGILVVGLVLVSWLSVFSFVQKKKAQTNLQRFEEQNEITVRLIRNFATVIASPKNNQQIELVVEDINKEIYRLSRKDKDSQRKKSIYLVLSGDLLSILHKNSESLQKYNNSLEIIKELAGENPEDGRLKIDLSISYRKIGNIQTKLNNNKIAAKEYDKSFSILTSDFNKEFIGDSYLQALWDLSLSYRNLGDNHLRFGNTEEVLSLYQKEFDLLDIFASNTSISDFKSSIQSELNLARSNKRIGEIEEYIDRNEDALKRYKDALKRFQNAFKIYHQSLTNDAPINKAKKEEIAGGLANIYDSLGRLIIKMANHDTLKLAEAEAFFAKTIAIAPNVLRFLIHDMELTRLQGDITRCRQRIATLDNLLLTPKNTKEVLYGSIVKFYDFLIEPEASWQPVLKAIERAKEIYHIFNLSQEDIYEIQQMPTFPRQATEAFIEYFEGKISLNELRQKLDKLQAAQPPIGGQ